MIYLLEGEFAGRHRQHQLARRILAYGLQEEYGIAGEPAVGTTSLGKPYLIEYPQIHFNYSHCSGGILCGISRHAIGVDIEGFRLSGERLVSRICHANEQRMVLEAQDRDRTLAVIWTAKESYLKYLGTGIRSDLRQLDLSAALREQARIGDACIHSFLEEEYAIGICCDSPSITIHRLCLRDEKLTLDIS